MINHQKYKKAFSLFLLRTNEKKVILGELLREISGIDGRSLLDIGAGDGSFLIPLSKHFNRVLAIEPNKLLAKSFAATKIQCLNAEWRDVNLKEKFDVILAAYVVTHFEQSKINSLLNKMYARLNPGGKLIILAIDGRRGSWRVVHTYFYKLIGLLKKKSSTLKVQQFAKKHNGEASTIRTNVVANDINEMLQILSFDFHRFGDSFEKNRPKLKKYLEAYIQNNKVVLEMVHRMFVIRK